jgi:Tol biopolymer transport system component
VSARDHRNPAQRLEIPMSCTSFRILRALSAFAIVSHVQAQAPALVDVTASGIAPLSGARDASVSADGRWVVFVSGAGDLVGGDGNGAADVFLCSRDVLTIARASIASGGVEAHPVPISADFPGVASPVVSLNGRFVAFASNAPDLVSGDTNGACDVFVRDVALGTTERVSISTSGMEGSSGSGAYTYTLPGSPPVVAQRASGVCMSPDGRFVAFASTAPELDASGSSEQQIYVRDRTSGITEIVSLDGASGPANAPCWFPSISDDGRFVAFDSAATNLVAADTNGVSDVFVRDRVLGQTVRVSVGAGDQEADAASGFSFVPFDNGCGCTITQALGSRISGNGRVIVFGSAATNLGSTPASSSDVYAHDRLSHATSLVSQSTVGSGGDGASFAPAISADGRYVAYVSSADDIVPVGGPSGEHVLLHDRYLAATRLASADPNGVATSEHAEQPSISADGAQLVFTTDAALSSMDVNTIADVYAFGAPLVAFGEACAGSASTCPCGNAGAPGAGCPNSFEPDGARLEASGRPSVSQDELVLVAHRLVPTTGVLFVQSGTSFTTATAPAFGDGVRCVGGNILRLTTRIATADAALLGVAQDARVSALGHLTSAGGTRYYQACYRNTLPYCTSATLNSTNSIRVDWVP